MNQITASTMLNRVEDEKNESIRYTSIFFHKYNIGGVKKQGRDSTRNGTSCPENVRKNKQKTSRTRRLQALIRLDTYFFGVISLFSLDFLIFGVNAS